MIYRERTCLIGSGARYLDSAPGPPGWDNPGHHIGRIAGCYLGAVVTTILPYPQPFGPSVLTFNS
jgi:hypothetical protein